MKIAVSAVGQGLESEVDPRFGRSGYFIIVEPETMQFEAVENPHPESPSGAGIGAAQLVCERGARTVLTGMVGPKAQQALSAAGIRVVTGVSGKVGDAVRRFKTGALESEGDPGTNPSMRSPAGMGRGMGGGGRGGMGRGMGCGGGKGMEIGPGRGGGGRPGGSRQIESRRIDEELTEDRDDLIHLKKRADALAGELAEIRRRIDRMERG